MLAEYYYKDKDYCSPCKDKLEASGRAPWKDPNKKEKQAIAQAILAYFQANSIKSIELKDNKLVIKYNHKQEVEQEPNSTELQQVKSYIETHHSNQLLFLSDLQTTNPHTEKPTNYLPYIISGGVIVVLLLVIVYLVSKNKRQN